MADEVIASVVIPALNVSDILPRQLRSLAHQSFEGEWEVIVADNGSSDGTQELIGNLHDRPRRLRTADASDRRGISHARNVGARQSRGRVILFCDADDVAHPDWVREMVRALDGFDVVGGRLEYEQLNDARTRSWRRTVSDHALPMNLGFLPYAVGANFGVRADVYREVGGFDEEFVVCSDDIDFSWRSQLLGRSIGFAPDAVVHYQLRAGLRPFARQQFLYGLYEARLYRKFRDLGLGRTTLWYTVKTWLRTVVRSLHLLRSAELRGNWIREASYLSGRVVGGIRFRTPYW